MDGRTALYRFFDETGALLYVGITNDTDVRWAVHAREKAWWPAVHRSTVEWKATRTEAEIAEAEAIGREAPRWNAIRPDADGKMLHGRKGGRPATGQTRVMAFRPKQELRDEFEELAAAEERSPSDALVEAMHDWVKKKRREQAAENPPAG
ncbi:GIY-YIG nuclease family protein [Streptomyces sp. NPDC060064]|uniref:GIY-YIG nuclease family protein n=1 Tax=Streptomyces sp. NPDC060064 TaxID=3347049 RepID=UPI00368E6C0D